MFEMRAKPAESDPSQALEDVSLNSLFSESHQAVMSARRFSDFVRPLYESFCFANLPGLFDQLLTGTTHRNSFPQAVTQSLGTFDRVVFLFFDAFGWESLQMFRDESPFLRRVEREGLLLQTTAQFPSTTAAHVTTALSGRAAFDHEVCGWDYYEPRAGCMIRPLKFSRSVDIEPGTLLAHGLKPEHVLPEGAFLHQLIDQGIGVRMYGPQEYFPSPYSLRYAPRESFVGYPNVDGGMRYLGTDGLREAEKLYVHFYFDGYDSACHKHGVGSVEANGVARHFLGLCEQLVVDASKQALPGRTLLVMSADHGQISDRNDGKIKVNEVLPSLKDVLVQGGDGELIRFSGGKRYLFLHTRPDATEHVVSDLKVALADKAYVMTLTELSNAGLLGPNPVAPSFAERLGSIGILPKPGFSVSWHEPGIFEDKDLSGHGGISPQEMETPLAFLPL